MNPAPTILLVDRNARNVDLLSSFLNESGYQTRGISSIEEFDAFLDALSPQPDVPLALVDLAGFDSTVWDRCRRLHEAEIAFVVIARARSSAGGHALRRQSFGAGAAHTLTKPLRKEQLLTLVKILTGTEDQHG